MERRPAGFVGDDRESRPYIIEGPGDVAIEYRPAGLGSRFLAALLDHVILACLLFFLASLLNMVSDSLGLITGGAMLFFLGYFIILESRKGRTVGKSALGLRVLSENGLPITPRAAIIRNILRMADFMPFGFPGVIVMMLDVHSRRLGDMLSGSVVCGKARTASAAICCCACLFGRARSIQRRCWLASRSHPRSIRPCGRSVFEPAP